MSDGSDFTELQRQIDALAQQVSTNREMIADLQADGTLSHDHVEQLETALKSSRTIGAAVGIIMAKWGLDQEHAFAVLRRVSQDHNRKLRDLAADIVATGALEPLNGTVVDKPVPKQPLARSQSSEAPARARPSGNGQHTPAGEDEPVPGSHS